MYVDVVFSIPVHKAFTYLLPSSLSCRIGSRVLVSFRKRETVGIVVAFPSKVPQGVKLQPVIRAIDGDPVLQDEHLSLGRWMQKMYFASLGECLHTMAPTGKREKKLQFQATSSQRTRILLSSSQKTLVDQIARRQSLRHYLYGVTGSGKTEVFLRIAELMMQEGKTVIYLVPEISLSYQLIDDVAARFGDASAILHSRLSVSERIGQWRAIQRGEKHIVIGTRSAVFAPVASLGMIIIDEEQDASYKSGHAPRYHARHIAAWRCQKAAALLVMGSATPSLEMWYQIRRGTLQCHKLTTRVSGGALPNIELVNMNKEEGVLSQRLLRCIAEVHREGRQSMLFINRRGFARVLRCMHCGFTLECLRCSVPLTFHKSTRTMLCHYCGYLREPLSVCPECNSMEMGYFSFGSEKIEMELHRIFPDLRIARLDSDIAKKRGEVKRILDTFARGNTDVLLGTQMIAKGLNFQGVKLVGIVLADVELTIPDFRAAERTFSHIVQVAGRAGRFSPDGVVIIQTYREKNPAIRKAIQHEVEDFFRIELAIRKELHFPPYSRMIRLLIRGEDKEKVEMATERIAHRAREKDCHDIEMLGPSFCLLSRIANNYRMHMLFLSADFRKVHTLVGELYNEMELPRQLYCEVDIDPLSVL